MVKQKINKKNDFIIHRVTIRSTGIVNPNHGKHLWNLWKGKYVWDQSINDADEEQWKTLISKWPKQELEQANSCWNRLWCHEKYATVWSDAKCALFWVRTIKITSAILTKLSKSDTATRGISPTKLRYSKLWWNGRYWLDKDPSQ
ncbi:unnamed protein product [Dracunculus medinensis]|uniref:C-type lectin domain-containing protein n=1 Tax=Dracunculus medinensis TaxID=318479 RepID=A0A158Q3Z5_DRAME|nr:unnamed protein product [Dracunculus medinensis]